MGNTTVHLTSMGVQQFIWQVWVYNSSFDKYGYTTVHLTSMGNTTVHLTSMGIQQFIW